MALEAGFVIFIDLQLFFFLPTMFLLFLILLRGTGTGTYQRAIAISEHKVVFMRLPEAED